MRARHRHFNHRDIGASLALDARFIAQNNNTSVSSWPDRSRNGYSVEQATAARQPVFETAGVGGQGAVKFDGNDVLDIASGYTNLFSGNNSYTAIVLTNLNSYSAAPVLWGTSIGQLLEYGTMSSVVYYWGGPADFRIYGTTNGALTTNTSYIVSVTKTAATSGTLYNNATPQASFTNNGGGMITTAVASGSLFLGAYTSAGGVGANGYIPAFFVFKDGLNDSQRKRCEHAAAFSFKISCN
jgi:hypothetical protein